MSERTSDDLQSEIRTREALLRMETIGRVEAQLKGLPDSPEAHARVRRQIEEEVEHHQRLIDGLTALLEADRQAFPEA